MCKNSTFVSCLRFNFKLMLKKVILKKVILDVKKVIFKRAILAVTLFAVTAGVIYAQYDLDHFYLRGRQALIEGKYGQAIENFNILANLDSTVYEAYFFRGIAKYNLGDFMGAQMD